MEGKSRIRETVAPFMAMALMEGCTIALTITTNSAMERGMNQFVFVAYSNALSSVVLLPYSCAFHKQFRMREHLSFKLLLRFFVLGFTGITMAQNLAFTGLSYSSPIVVCGMGLLLPSFQFFLLLLRGKAQLDIRRSSGKIRLFGTLASFTGAVVVATYKGSSIIQAPLIKHGSLRGPRPLLVFASGSPQWLLGCVLLALATLFVALWSTLQVSTFKKCPDMMVTVTWYVLFGTIQTTVVDALAERDLSAWKLSLNLELIVMVLTAIFGTFVRSKVQAWCMSMKGPVYVSLFKPFGIFWACAISLSFFGSSLHFGSVMGATLSGIGYYAMLWGATKEQDEKREDESSKTSFVFEDDRLKAPLLQAQEDLV